MKFTRRLWSVAFVLMGTSYALAESPAPVDPALPVYQRGAPLKGTIELVGSNTMSNIAAVWAEGFRKLYPEVEFNIQVRGSVNAVPAVTSGEATFGLLSRTLNEGEVKAFYEKFGYLPTVLTPAFEPVAIFVHKDNPIQSLSLSQLDAVYSAKPQLGEKKTIMTWGELGATGRWANAPIVCQGRSNTTGSQVYLQTAILRGAPFRDGVVENGSNLDLIKSIVADPRSIGFAGASFTRPEIKALELSYRTGDPAIAVDTAGYPLVRHLQLVVNRSQQQELPAVQSEFLKYVFSGRGQRDVLISGFTPVPSRAAQIALDAIGEASLQ